jgi:hypothetical protein
MRVKLWLVLRRVLSILAVLGVVTAPLSTPSIASAAGIGEMIASEAMPGDMPCCPEQPVPPDCLKACPLLTICTAKTFLTSLESVTWVTGMSIIATAIPRSDASRPSLAQGPPERPPQA